MTTVIYADSLLAVNFSMDFLALYIAAKLLHITIRPARLAVGALIGAVFALASVISEPYMRGGAWMIVMIAASVMCAFIMTACALGGRVISAALTYGAVNIGLGGVMTALYSFIGKAADAYGVTPVSASPSTSPLLFAVISLISGAVSLLYGKFRTRSVDRRHVTATIEAFGSKFETTLLCDSGNLLREPFGGKPVLILSAATLEGILPAELIETAKAPERMTSLPEAIAKRIRLIPAGSVMGDGMLLGFIPERINIDGREIDAVAAIGTGTEDYDGSDGIIPQALITI